MNIARSPSAGPPRNPSRIPSASVLVAALSLAACVDTSPDRVKLTANISDVSLTVAQSSLATSLSGSFTVHLALGDLAQGNATVTDPPTFQLVTAANRSEIATLDALVQGATFPVTVTPGSASALSYVLNDQQTLPQPEKDAICSGEVEIAGSLKDSSNGDQPLSFESAPVTAGCP